MEIARKIIKKLSFIQTKLNIYSQLALIIENIVNK